MKLIFWGLVAVALLWVAYSGMLAAWSWIAVNNAVDEIVSKDDVATIPSRELKTKVMSAANEAGVPLGEKDVVVTNTGGQGVSIEVLWTVPVIIVNGDAVFAVPLAVRRSSGGAASKASASPSERERRCSAKRLSYSSSGSSRM